MPPTYVLLDMNTQRDFLDAEGAHPVVNRETLVGTLRRIFALTRTYHVPLVSSIDTHRPNERFRGAPHCVEGSPGQQKMKFTLLRNRTLVEANNTLDLPYDIWSQYRQVILRRRTRDFLGNPKADRLLTELNPKLFILFGVGLERSIRRLALGLLGRGREVAIVKHACGFWNETDADLTSRLLQAKGGKEIELAEVDTLLHEASQRRVRRVFSKARLNPRRSLAS
jgi:nicotinamidase-related amidase